MHVCSIVTIAKTVGANRIVPSVAIPHPLGDPTKSKEEELAIRRELLQRAVTALEADVTAQTVFDS